MSAISSAAARATRHFAPTPIVAIVSALVAATPALIAGSGGRVVQGPDQLRAVCISVLDAAGSPVTDLTAADVSISENDQAQQVVRLQPATDRLSIAILVDDSGIGIDQLRLGIARMMNPLLGDAVFSLIGLAGQNQTLLEFTDRNDALVAAVRGLHARTGQSGQHVIEAVGDSLKVLERREATRPVVVVLTNEAREASNSAVEPVIDRLIRDGASLHVVEVMQPGRVSAAPAQSPDSLAAFSRSNDAAEGDRSRSQLLNDGPASTGGRRQQLMDPAGVATAMTAIAHELQAQYVLVFRSTAKVGDLPKIAITTTRTGLKIDAPSRASSRPVK